MLAALRSYKSAASLRVGVSLAPEGVAVAAVHWDKTGSPILEHCVYRPLPPDSTVFEFAPRLLNELRLGRAAISTVIQPGEYQLVLVEAPEVQPSELRAAVRWRLKDAIDFHLDDAVVDVFELPAPARGNSARMLYAVAARHGAVAAHVAALQRLRGFDVVDIPELCLRNVAGRLERDGQGIVLLQLTPGGAQVIVARRGTLYLSRHIDIPAQADARDADVIVDAGMVALEMQRSLDYYERTYDQPPITDLAVGPAGRRAAMLAPRLAAEASLKSRIVDLNQIVTSSQRIGLEDQDRCLLALGAALRREQQTL